VKKNALSLVFPALVLFAASTSARAGLMITPTFDTTITTNPAGAAIEGVIDNAISFYEATFSNNIDVSIYFQVGGGLGESDTGYTYLQTYTNYYNGLVANNANPTAIASLGGPDGGNDPVLGNSMISVNSADSRAVGLGGAGLCIVTAGDTTPATGVPNHCDQSGNPNNNGQVVDGIISLNTYITTPPGTQTNPAIYYSLMAVTEHEIDEVLGLGSSLPNTASSTAIVGPPANISPEDLFRYSTNSMGTITGRSTLTENCASPGTAVFSINGISPLTGFNNSCNGADWGDWLGGDPTYGAQVQDAYGTPGATETLGPNEIQALTAIGYIQTAPEPSTFVLLFGSLAGSLALIGLVRRRRN